MRDISLPWIEAVSRLGFQSRRQHPLYRTVLCLPRVADCGRYPSSLVLACQFEVIDRNKRISAQPTKRLGIAAVVPLNPTRGSYILFPHAKFKVTYSFHPSRVELPKFIHQLLPRSLSISTYLVVSDNNEQRQRLQPLAVMLRLQSTTE